jgi:hypothetical protein
VTTIATKFNITAIITNGSSAGRVAAIETGKDPRWGAAGIHIDMISLEQFGGNPGQRTFLPGYLLGSWRTVPFEWRPVVGGQVEERYVWADGYRRLQREVRKVEAS